MYGPRDAGADAARALAILVIIGFVVGPCYLDYRRSTRETDQDACRLSALGPAMKSPAPDEYLTLAEKRRTTWTLCMIERGWTCTQRTDARIYECRKGDNTAVSPE